MVVGPKKTLFLDEISTGLVRVLAPGHTMFQLVMHIGSEAYNSLLEF